ncbi:MAG: response regulator [Rhodospirillaceae bacterium]|nr:MAG: response regulator [Rhodospirillaceae bacterium]
MKSANPTVVIIDDDNGVRNSVRFLLELDGFAVEDFGSAASFFSKCDLENIDCLIVDQSMPETTGLTLTAQLRAIGSKLPVILITALPDPEIIEQARGVGIYKVLRKPFPDNVLPKLILEAIAAKP